MNEEGQDARDATPVRSRGGRKRDPTRDDDILDATLDVLAEVGYAGLTTDLVAARAQAGKATMYRRWHTKDDLILDAVRKMKRDFTLPDRLPDTGTLRGDLVGLIRDENLIDGDRTLGVMAAMTEVVARHPGIADTVHDIVHCPWAAVQEAVMRRARDRGEIPPSARVETVSQVMASMAAYRVMIQRRVVDRPFLEGLIDDVILPALHADR
ncbi:MAG TPA: TetR/AcrR family transcriptional regulator [Thermomicrobiales bacterium]|nr:TetR/AcrR family transcriptional regulator [Thermomicrobiales bacterium]